MAKPNPTLAEFGKCTLALTELLGEDVPLDIIEQVFLENHIHVIRLAYGAWKRRNSPQGTQGPDAD